MSRAKASITVELYITTKNGVAYNSINNVLILARTIMIHSALRWPDAIKKSLCPIYMYRAIYLHNHTPHIFSGLYPEEVWTRSNSSHSSLQNYHPWIFPAYVLKPRLQDGNKFPK